MSAPPSPLVLPQVQKAAGQQEQALQWAKQAQEAMQMMLKQTESSGQWRNLLWTSLAVSSVVEEVVAD